MVKIGKLEVQTVGSLSNRLKVVKLPGHEYQIEHFLPENLEVISRNGKRTKIVRSLHDKSQELRFVIKKRSENLGSLSPISELRLAQYINGLKLEDGVKVEEPLAAILTPSGEHEVIYRYISHTLNQIYDDKNYRNPLYVSKPPMEHTAELIAIS